jgi:hypothetical protein
MSADFGIVVDQQSSALRGCMVVAKPLLGSGALEGRVRGSQVAFDVTSRLFTINFSGAMMNPDDMSGNYVIAATPTSGPQGGRFALHKVGGAGLPPGFDLRDCPDEFSRQIAGTSVPFPAKETPAGAFGQVASISAQNLRVKIIDRQDKEDEYYYAAVYNNVALGKTFKVHGATFTLQLPDGRLVIVNCESKFAEHFAGPAGNRRSCRMPVGDTIQVDFKGDNAKLIWPVSLDGKKTQSETYKILGVLDKPKSN